MLLLFKCQTQVLPSSFHWSLLKTDKKGDPHHLDLISNSQSVIFFLFLEYFLKMTLFVGPHLRRGVLPGEREPSKSAHVALMAAYNLPRARCGRDIRRLVVSRSSTDPRLVIRKSFWMDIFIVNFACPTISTKSCTRRCIQF
jgi:hypothetical protein